MALWDGIIKAALVEIGAQAAADAVPQSDLEQGVERLAWLLEEWAVDGLLVPGYVTYRHKVTQSKQVFTLGVDQIRDEYSTDFRNFPINQILVPREDGSPQLRVADSGSGLLIGGANGGRQWLILNNAQVAYEDNRLYFIEFFIRDVVQGTESVQDNVWLGVAGFAADGMAYVNQDGANSFESHYYVAAQAFDDDRLSSDDERLSGFFGGLADMPSVSYLNRTPLGSGNKLHTNVRFIAPYIIINDNNRAGTGGSEMVIDSVKIRSVPTNDVETQLWPDLDLVVGAELEQIETLSYRQEGQQNGRPIKQISHLVLDSIDSVTATSPSAYFYNRNYPVSSITFDALPYPGDEFTLTARSHLPTPKLGETVMLPPGYANAITLNLAVELAPSYGVKGGRAQGLSSVTMIRAQKAKATLRKRNLGPTTVRLDPALQSRGTNQLRRHGTSWRG